MKHLLFLMLAFFCSATMMFAAKANSQPFQVRQPDGTCLTVVLHGDEHLSWYTTTDGVVLASSKNHFYVAQIDAQGRISATSQLAHNPQARGVAEARMAKAQQSAPLYAAHASARNKAAQAASRATVSFFPHKGSPTALVILAQFQDTVFHMADPKASFEQFLNGEGELVDMGCGEARNHGSVRQYFSDMSAGQFTPHFKVVGPVTLPGTLAYYGANTNSVTDANYDQFLKDACQQAASLVDFSDPELDADGDGNIDVVNIIYAGFGENNGAQDDALWAKCSVRTVGTYAGKNVCLTMISHELNANERQLKTVNPSSTSSFSVPQISGIGVFCHEFSHAMGLPDLYATSSNAEISNQCMEYWSVMDGGEYVNNSYFPTAYTAWERSVMGWQQPKVLDTDGTFTLKTYAEGGDCYKLANSNNANDYLLFENIQRQGWNSYLRGHGLLAYRVSLSGSISPFRPLNNTPGKPGVTVVPADGLLLNYYTLTSGTSSERLAIYRTDMGGDPFPGTKNVTTLTAAQGLPNYEWRTEPTAIAEGLVNISEDNDQHTVTFTFSKDVAAGIQQVRTDASSETSKAIYTIDGRYVGTDASVLPQGVYLLKGKKIVR